MGSLLAIAACLPRGSFVAAAAAGGGGGDMLTMLLYLGLFAALMFFLVFLPQRRRDKKAKEMLASVKVGDTVTTHSGVVGKIVNIRDDVYTLQSGVERTQIDFKKWAIKDVQKMESA